MRLPLFACAFWFIAGQLDGTRAALWSPRRSQLPPHFPSFHLRTPAIAFLPDSGLDTYPSTPFLNIYRPVLRPTVRQKRFGVPTSSLARCLVHRLRLLWPPSLLCCDFSHLSFWKRIARYSPLKVLKPESRRRIRFPFRAGCPGLLKTRYFT